MLQYKTWKLVRNSEPWVVRYPLLTVEGRGAHPRASGVRKQVWACGADAGGLPRLEGGREKELEKCKPVNQKRCHLGEMGWHTSHVGTRQRFHGASGERIAFGELSPFAEGARHHFPRERIAFVERGPFAVGARHRFLRAS